MIELREFVLEDWIVNMPIRHFLSNNRCLKWALVSTGSNQFMVELSSECLKCQCFLLLIEEGPICFRSQMWTNSIDVLLWKCKSLICFVLVHLLMKMGQRATYRKLLIFFQGECKTVETVGQVIMYDFSARKYS